MTQHKPRGRSPEQTLPTTKTNNTPLNQPPPELADVLQQVDSLLQAGQPARALDVLQRTKSQSPWVKNAIGVCQLRLGNSRTAVEVFRSLVVASGSIQLRTDIPAVFKANFAAALLQADNLGGCLSALGSIDATEHPAVGRLQSAIADWKSRLTFWQKLKWSLSGEPGQPVVVPFAPGDVL